MDNNSIPRDELERKLNEFYNKWILLPNAAPNSYRYICHTHTEELAKYFNIKLEFKK